MRRLPQNSHARLAATTRIAAIGLVLILSASPAVAADDGSVAWTDVGHPWSLWKWLGYAVTVGLAWLACSRLYFDNLIDHRRAWPVWPRDAFARSMWLFILIFCVSFVGWFHTALRNRRFIPSLLPRWGGVGLMLNDYWLAIAITLAGIVAASIFLSSNKHTERHAGR